MADETGERDAWSWRREGLWFLEVLALTAVVVARPVLAMLGGAPMVFRAREATPLVTSIWLVLLVAVPALAVWAVGLAGHGLNRLAERRRPRRGDLRWPAHVTVVAALAGLAGWRFMAERPDMGPSSWAAVLVGLIAATGIGFIRWWTRSREIAATFLRWAAVACLVFVGQFLLSDAGREVYRSPRTVDTEAAAAVADQVGDDPPPVVVVVLDELPTATLLDSDGGIDGDLFPNLAAFADGSTWYRNNTANALSTWTAVPSIITGTYLPNDHDARQLGPSLFTLLGETHELSVSEEVTDMCGPPYCDPGSVGATLTGLASDARWVWDEAALPPELMIGALPGLEEDRRSQAEAWIDDLDLDGGDAPPFVFHHMLLPHSPWELLPDGSSYRRVSARAIGLDGWYGDEDLIDLSTQQHLLQAQATDGLVGRMLDRLEDEGIFEDALVVVTADHGHGFIPGEGRRHASEGSLHQTLWAPLLVKLPGQEEGRVVDHNVQSVDILPTIADVLGVDLPWEIDGVPAHPEEARRDSQVTFTSIPLDEIEETRGGLVELDGRDHFRRLLEDAPLWPGTGPEAAWQRTDHHGLLRTEVDDLDIGESVAADVELLEPARWRPGAEVPSVVLTVGTDLDEETVVAFAVDGTVAGLTEVVESGPNLAQVLLLPELLVEDAELEAFVVEGPVGDETLRPLPSPT